MSTVQIKNPVHMYLMTKLGILERILDSWWHVNCILSPELPTVWPYPTLRAGCFLMLCAISRKPQLLSFWYSCNFAKLIPPNQKCKAKKKKKKIFKMSAEVRLLLCYLQASNTSYAFFVPAAIELTSLPPLPPPGERIPRKLFCSG